MHDRTGTSNDRAPADDHREILRDRARRLAAPPRQETGGQAIEVLEFGLADERYALESCHVHDVQQLRDLTPLPCTPPFIRGLVNVRGRLVPVIDLKKFLGLPEPGITDLHRVVLLRGAGIEIGLLADTVEGVQLIDSDRIQPSLPTLTDIGDHYLRGVTAERLVILDAQAILDDPRIIVDEDIET